MPEFVTLTCPSCGGKLEITEDIERFACANCGKEHLVKRGGGTILIRPITDGLAKVQTGVDRTAAELAIVRLKKEIPALKDALENKNMELQAEADYLLELSTETKKAERRKLREYAVLLAMSVVLIAISIRLSNVARSGYLPYLSRWGPIFCWLPVALVVLAQSLIVYRTVRYSNRLKRDTVQLSDDYLRYKELCQEEIEAIEGEIAGKEQELADNQKTVSVRRDA